MVKMEGDFCPLRATCCVLRDAEVMRLRVEGRLGVGGWGGGGGKLAWWTLFL